jgi:hypothetical protein
MAIIKSKLNDGTELMIETGDIPVEELSSDGDEFRDMPKSVGKIIDSGKNLLREAIIRMQLCASEIAAGINDIEEKMRPDEVEASLAFKLTAEAGAIITKLGGEAQLQVKLLWKNQKQK